MKTNQFFNIGGSALITVVLGFHFPAVNAQSTVQMPAEIVKPMSKMDLENTPGMDMKPMMMDMQDKTTAMKSSGNMDVDFAMMMRVHHQSAITMAETELQNGKDPQMRAMAKEIIRAQKKEIAAFDKFLAKRGDAGTKMSEPGMSMKK